jgi:hypothetical protein
LGKGFEVDDFERAYEASKDDPDWLRFEDPCKFYEPLAIVHRQGRWAREGARIASDELLDDDFAEDGGSETYVHAIPSIRRMILLLAGAFFLREREEI